MVQFTQKQFKMKALVKSLLIASTLTLAACGGDNDNEKTPDDSPESGVETPSTDTETPSTDTETPNTAPVVSGSDTLSVAPEKTKSVQITVTDAEDDEVEYSVKSVTGGSAEFNAETAGQLDFTAADQKGAYEVIIEVSDGTNKVTKTIAIKVENTAPKVNSAIIAMPTETSATFQVSASDYDGDTLSYEITQPSGLSATVDQSGLVTFNGMSGSTPKSSFVVTVTDSEAATSSARIDILPSVTDVSNATSFKNQFYKVANSTTGNSQIVHYDSENSDPNTNQKVIKTDVILADKVFVMDGTQDGDKTTYVSRKYGIFLDPSAAKEDRTFDDDGVETAYTHQLDHTLKAFDASATGTERTIFSGSMLSQDLQNAGIKVIDGGYNLKLNHSDITNSYAKLMAYSALADGNKGETPKGMPHLPITVRLSDGAHTAGKPLGLIKKSDYTTDKVLVNYVAPHTEGNYPADDASKKRLQTCDTALTNCTDVTDASGNYFNLAENTTHIYLTKQGSDKIFAFDKSTLALAEVTGVSYPAVYDKDHHGDSLSGESGHSGSGVFSNFWNLLSSKESLSEGANAYAVINYNLDKADPIKEGPYDKYRMYMKGHKNAMVVKLTGTTAVKVYDNGAGVDLMNESDDITTNYHIGLIAVQDGNIMLEAARINGGMSCKTEGNCMTYRQAWLKTDDITTAKTAFDNEVIAEDLKYLTGFRSTPKVVNDSIYFTMRTGTPVSHGGTGTVYNVWKLPTSDISLGKAEAEAGETAGAEYLKGRMLFERTAFRTSGVYDGTVVLWDSNTGDLKDASNGVVLGNDSMVEEGDEVVDSVTGISSSNNLAGVGGIFGLHLSGGHGDSGPFLISAESNSANSATIVNEIDGDWITD